jgi:starch-binding outer membrane protein, SusD/RagB family
MKKIFIIITAIFLGACTDLDVLPKDRLLAEKAFTNESSYKQYLAKLYASLSLTGQQGPAGKTDLSIITDEGFTSYIRAYWKAQELTTDEAVIAWSDAGVRDLHTHQWSSENQFIRVLYYRILYTVSLCNDYLAVSTEDFLDGVGIEEASRIEIRQFRAEARFIRALAYSHALDLYRNVPLITQVSADLPKQVSPTVLFDFIESELIDIESVLPAAKQAEYGRADKAAVWMLKAQLYLNAEVYTGKARYADCLKDCEKVIASGYTLATDYKLNFRADNHTSPELIFTLPADGVYSQSWGSTTFLVHGAIGGTMKDTDYGVLNAWAGMRTTSTFVSKFPDVTGTIDKRAIFYTSGQNLEIADIADFKDGYAVPKFTNLTTSGAPGSNTTHVDTDYPLYRLADAYLMYAEAHLRNGGGDAATALGYINALRARAYGNANGAIALGEMTLDFILDERSRELYWEGYRRIDLIRFGQFTDKGIWPWKGGVAEGKLTETYRNIFPIPSSDLTANSLLKQNDRY